MCATDGTVRGERIEGDATRRESERMTFIMCNAVSSIHSVLFIKRLKVRSRLQNRASLKLSVNSITAQALDGVA